MVAPTALAFGAWFTPGAVHGRDGLLLPDLIATSGFVPLGGLVPVVVYVWRIRDWVLLVPYVPFAFVASLFAVSMVVLAVTIPRDESQNAIIPVAQVSSGFVQAWLALGGGAVSYSLVRRRHL